MVGLDQVAALPPTPADETLVEKLGDTVLPGVAAEGNVRGAASTRWGKGSPATTITRSRS